ncbi:MAG: dienelactone hydrolase family protein [Woeseiaceae bacterium]|nr:dienelactone hydrolase family protein [Woeseiaceae bacterium]
MRKAADYDPRILKLFDGYVHGAITRRQFIDRAAAFATAGMSAAAILASLSPDYALAQQVDPDDKSITTDYKKYASPDGAGVMQGYFARPAVVEHKLPGVVVIHENRGLNPYIEDVTRRLAVAGFIGFAPDALFPLGGYPGNDDDGRTMQRQRDGDEMRADFVAAVDYLQQHPDCDGKVGSVGFCFGGGMSMYLAVNVPTLAAAVAFYGRHPTAEDARKIEAPLLVIHGELDERVNASWPEFEKGLKAAGKDYRQIEYAGANHGFHNDTTPRYDEKQAERAWGETIAFFEKHLV